MPRNKNAKTRPVEMLSEGTLRAAIWKNSGPNGTEYTATFSRAYVNRAGFTSNTASFKAAHLAEFEKLIKRTNERLSALNKAVLAKMAA